MELEPDCLLLLPEGALGVTAATMAALPASAQAGLYEYLEAAAGEDPGGALGHLLAEMEAAPRLTPTAEATLRQQVRQVVAFRDGSWGLGLARVRPGGGALRAVAAGAAERRAAAAAPDPDRFLPRLRRRGGRRRRGSRRPTATRWPKRWRPCGCLQLAERTVRLTDPAELRQALEGYAAAFADLPVNVDEALRRATRRAPAARSPHQRVEEERRGGSQAALAGALGLALAAVALLTQRLAAASLGSWVEGLGAAAFLLVGGLLLRVLARPG